MLTPEQEQVISKEALYEFPPVDGYDFEQQCSGLGYTTAATAYQQTINERDAFIEERLVEYNKLLDESKGMLGEIAGLRKALEKIKKEVPAQSWYAKIIDKTLKKYNQ